MSRVKTFDSTGLATSGRLYAGDLNAIQDQYADLTNLAQNLSVGTLAVGESGLQLIRYAAGEARITGHARVDGILRGLSGLYAGAYTSTARDAIATGFRPYGLIILNTTNNRLEVNLGTDPSPVWLPLGGGFSTGTLAARPAAGAANSGTLYFATDDQGGTLYESNGSSWTKIAPGLNEPLQINTQTTSYTLVLTDQSKVVEISNAGATTVTVPADASVAFPIGTTITIVQLGGGIVTIAGAAGVTLRFTPGQRTAGQYAEAALYKRAANDWVLGGNLQP